MIIQPGIAKANMGFSREDVTMEDHVSQVCCYLLLMLLTAATSSHYMYHFCHMIDCCAHDTCHIFYIW